MTEPFSKKQIDFLLNSTATWNIAHGAVRSGKTVCTTYRFMQAVDSCPDSKIYIVGHTFDTAYRNVVRMILDSPQLSIFKPFCNWSGEKLYFKDKTITILGAKDEGAIKNFQGDTFSLVLCDEMTLYPESIIDMIDTRLSASHSMGFASMNPAHPTHKVKQWIDKGIEGNKNYYSLHFVLEDNPYVTDIYKSRVGDSLSGLFYKRNYLGMWCLAEGSIFDFFDKKINVVERPPEAAEYWIAAIDYGTVNPFCCLLIGVSTGKYTQTSKKMWVEKEYYWNPAKTHKQKVNSEFADDVKAFLEPYSVKNIYIDPSAQAFQLELQRRGMHPVHANNDVLNGIQMMTKEMKEGTLVICSECKNLIREVETYVWDSKQSAKGYDEPMKKDDHAVDALRYAIATHKVAQYKPYKDGHDPDAYGASRFNPPTRRF